MSQLTTSVASKMKLYDQVGYILVGAVGLLTVCFDLLITGRSTVIPSLTLENMIVWAVVAYFAGHVFQAVANMLIKDRKGVYSEDEIKVLGQAREYFSLPGTDDSFVFQHCYMLSTAKDLTGHIAVFNANHSLYRGWEVVFGIQTFFCLLLTLVLWFSWGPPILAVVFGLTTYLFDRRRRRFWKYLTAKTIQTFVLIRRLEQ